MECNPNTIEILGLDEDQYLIRSALGQELLDNRSMFLSKRAIKSFGGYAGQQLRRLQNSIARDTLPQNDREKHILRSVTNALNDFNLRYTENECDRIKLYIDDSDNPEHDTEIFVDADYKHFPLRDYTDMWSTMRTVLRDYDKIGKRNKKKDGNPQIPEIRSFIEMELEKQKKIADELVDDHNKDWSGLNSVFAENLG